jgi:hypothetical protein
MLLVYSKLIFDGIDKWKGGALQVASKKTIKTGQSIKYWEKTPHPEEPKN